MGWLTSLLGQGQQQVLGPDATFLDVVVYIAGLASRPTEVDPILDPVRELTARLAPDEPLTEAHEDTLCVVYLNLERYLTTKEPLRTFTRQELRNHLGTALAGRLQQFEQRHPQK